MRAWNSSTYASDLYSVVTTESCMREGRRRSRAGAGRGSIEAVSIPSARSVARPNDPRGRAGFPRDDGGEYLFAGVAEAEAQVGSPRSASWASSHDGRGRIPRTFPHA